MEHKKTGHDDSMDLPEIDMSNVDLGGAFKQFIEVIKLNKKVIAGVAENKKSGSSAAVFLAVGAVALPVAQLIFGVRFLNVVYRPDAVSLIIQAVLAVVMAALVLYITSLVATRLFKGKGSFANYFRVMGLAYGLNVLMFLGPVIPALVPLISLVVGIWMLVINYTVIKDVFKLDNTNTILTIIVTIVAFIALGAVIASLGFGAAQSSVDLSNISITY
jgi:hypothetical protein